MRQLLQRRKVVQPKLQEVEQWQQHVDYCNQQRINLVYHSTDRGEANLLCHFDDNNGLWKTLNSMRNVENTALMKLLAGVKAV